MPGYLQAKNLHGREWSLDLSSLVLFIIKEYIRLRNKATVMWCAGGRPINEKYGASYPLKLFNSSNNVYHKQNPPSLFSKTEMLDLCQNSKFLIHTGSKLVCIKHLKN